MKQTKRTGRTKRALLVAWMAASSTMSVGCAGGPVGGILGSLTNLFKGGLGGPTQKTAQKTPKVRPTTSTQKKDVPAPPDRPERKPKRERVTSGDTGFVPSGACMVVDCSDGADVDGKEREEGLPGEGKKQVPEIREI